MPFVGLRTRAGFHSVGFILSLLKLHTVRSLAVILISSSRIAMGWFNLLISETTWWMTSRLITGYVRPKADHYKTKREIFKHHAFVVQKLGENQWKPEMDITHELVLMPYLPLMSHRPVERIGSSRSEANKAIYSFSLSRLVNLPPLKQNLDQTVFDIRNLLDLNLLEWKFPNVFWFKWSNRSRKKWSCWPNCFHRQCNRWKSD